MLRNILRALMAIVLVAYTVVGTPAQSVEPAELIKQVETKYEKVTSIRAEFSQTTRNALFGEETVGGTVVLKRPGMMRWEFGDQKLFVTNGSKMWIYTAEDKQVIEYDDISSQRGAADSLLTSLDKLDEMFKIEVLSSTDAGHTIKLLPNDEGQFKNVVLTVDAELMVQKIVITDTFDNTTEIVLKNVELNAKADDSLFTFAVPDGVDVIKAATN